MIVEILNDTAIDIECFLHSDKQHRHIVLKTGDLYSISIKTSRLTIDKEDIWNTRSYLNIFLLLLYSFDMMFGSMMDSINMPFSIEYELNLSMCKNNKILASNILKSNENNIKLWSKISTFQIVLIYFIVFIIGITFSFILSGWYSVIVISLFAIVGGIIAKKLFCRRDYIKSELMKYS